MSLVVKIYACRTTANSDITQFSGNAWYTEGVIDYSTYVLDQEIIIDDEVELSEAFEFQSGQTNVSFQYSFSLWNYLKNNVALSRETNAFGLEIILDGIKKFWGVINEDSIFHDKINGIITLSATNWSQRVIETIGHKIIPDLSGYTLAGFLRSIFVKGTSVSIATDVAINVGGLDTSLDYEGTSSFHYYDTLVDYQMNVADFILDLQKHYGAFLFIDADRVLHFISRGLYTSETSIPIDDYLLDENYSELYVAEEEHNSLVINGVGDLEEIWLNGSLFGYQQREDWFVLYEEYINGVATLRSIALDGDLENIPANAKKYLDLRQILKPVDTNVLDSGFEVDKFYHLYPVLEIDDLYELYKTVLKKSVEVECSIYGYSAGLFNKVSLGGVDYQVWRLSRNILDATSDLVLRRIYN